MGCLKSKYLPVSQCRLTTFLGSASSMELLGTNVSKILRTTKVGHYEHANGLAGIHQQADPAVAARQIAAIQSTWTQTCASIVSGGGSGFGEVAASVPSTGYLALFKEKYPYVWMGYLWRDMHECYGKWNSVDVMLCPCAEQGV